MAVGVYRAISLEIDRRSISSHAGLLYVINLTVRRDTLMRDYDASRWITRKREERADFDEKKQKNCPALRSARE